MEWDGGDTGRVGIEGTQECEGNIPGVSPSPHSPLTLLQQAGVRHGALVRSTELCGAGPCENRTRAASRCQSAPTVPPPPSASPRASVPLSHATCSNTLWDGSGTGQAGSTEPRAVPRLHRMGRLGAPAGKETSSPWPLSLEGTRTERRRELGPSWMAATGMGTRQLGHILLPRFGYWC